MVRINYNASAKSRTDILRALHEMERANRQPNNVRSTVATNNVRSSVATNNASLCLRIAAERGKTMEVKRFLAAGATVSNDSVSKNIPLRLIGHCFVFSSAFESPLCPPERVKRAPQGGEVGPHERGQAASSE